jgi:hypothetical protein
VSPSADVGPIIPTDPRRHGELVALRGALERCWCAETSFWPDEWTPARPSHGQCAVTAVVVHGRFGGEICRTTNQGVLHYWNRLDGVDVDLTRDQFDRWAPEAVVVTVAPDDLLVSGPTLAARHRLLSELLAARS